MWIHFARGESNTLSGVYSLASASTYDQPCIVHLYILGIAVQCMCNGLRVECRILSRVGSSIWYSIGIAG